MGLRPGKVAEDTSEGLIKFPSTATVSGYQSLRSGFTLIELLAVIAIIAILVALILPAR